MGIFDDYIADLENQETVDPLKVAADLFDLHSNELGTREAKINELTGTIAEKDSTIFDLNNEIQAQKARNFDLAMQIPAQKESNANQSDNDDEPITINSLFRKK